MRWDTAIPVIVFGMVSEDVLKFVMTIGIGLLFFAGWAAVLLTPLIVWRNRVIRRGYPGLRAYLRELPRTEEETLDAVELTLKGIAICVAGLLFPPLVLIGLVPFYYGARKWAAAAMGIAGADDAR